MQSALEAEAKGKAEAMRMKKKLESDVGELEIALEHSNANNLETQKAIKKFQTQIISGIVVFLQLVINNWNRHCCSHSSGYSIFFPSCANMINTTKKRFSILDSSNNNGIP